MEGISPISWLADFDFGSASDFAGVGMKFSQRIGEMFAYCSLPRRVVGFQLDCNCLPTVTKLRSLQYIDIITSSYL